MAAALALGGAARTAPGPALSFSAAKHYATGKEPNWLSIGDLNGDGKPDAVTVNSGKPTVSVLLNRGDGRFAGKRDYLAGTSQPLAIADLNADGSSDLAMLPLSVLLNHGDGTFETRQVYGACCPQLFAVDDLNGDNRPDIVTVGESVSVFLNDGAGRFLSRRVYAAARDNIRDLDLADMNRDGRPDIVTSNPPFDSNGERVNVGVSVYLNNGDGSFQQRRDFKARGGLLVVTDMNRDRSPDVVTEYAPLDTPGFVTVLLNRGHGRFQLQRVYKLGPWVGAFSIVDLNADGAPDLTIRHGHKVSVFVNRGNGRLVSRRDYAFTPLYNQLVVGDVNGGGSPDLVFASWDLGRVAVLVNRGKGTFRRPIEFNTGAGPVALALPDLDGDGSSDIVTMSEAEVVDGRGDRISALLATTGLCNVQDVFGRPLASVPELLARGHCRLGRVTWGYSSVRKGHVMGQRPKFGAVRPRGTAVNVNVSRGWRG
jgi:FG-GAP-like repeat